MSQQMIYFSPGHISEKLPSCEKMSRPMFEIKPLSHLVCVCLCTFVIFGRKAFYFIWGGLFFLWRILDNMQKYCLCCMFWLLILECLLFTLEMTRSHLKAFCVAHMHHMGNCHVQLTAIPHTVPSLLLLLPVPSSIQCFSCHRAFFSMPAIYTHATATLYVEVLHQLAPS